MLWLTAVLILQQPGPAPVKVADVESRRVKQTAALVGTVRAWRRSTVAAEVEGRVVKLRFDEGDTVKAGAPLAVLDSALLRIQIKAAESALAAARARHEQSKTRLARLKRLIDQKVVSEDELETGSKREEELGHEAARSGDELNRLKITLEKKTIAAPFDGIVVVKKTEVGQWVSAGGAVAVVVDLSRVEVRVDLPARHIAGVSRGTRVDIRVDAYKETVFSGTVVAVVPVADTLSRNFPLRVEVPNTDERLKDGMLCTVEVPLEAERDALLVPKDAIVSRGNATFVVTVVDGKARSVPVTIGRGYEGMIEVRGSLKAGQKVVTRGNERLRDGQAVKPE